MDEVRLALRRLMNRPGAAVASIVTLGCSIGAAAATWSLISAALLSPLRVADPERLLVLGMRDTAGREAGVVQTGFTYPYFRYVRDSGILEQVAAEWSPPMLLLASTGSLPVQTRVSFVSHDFFDVLGVRVPIGRGFDADDDRRGAPIVALLTDRYWRRGFDADPSVLGRTITIAGKAVTIIGIAPARFRGINLAEAPDLFVPLHTIADVGPALTNYFAEAGHVSAPTAGMTLVARPRLDATATQAQARLEALAPPPRGPGSPRAQMSPPQFAAMDINTHAIPAAARAGMAQFTQLLGATVGLLVLIGCGTVGMLLLVRTEARREEFAMCLALGASRARLARGVGIEGAMLAIAGAALAMPVAWWLFNGIRAFELPGGVSIELLELTVDVRALIAAAACAVAATLLITLVAGVFGFSADIHDALRARVGATPRIGRRRTRAVLVSGQVAIALVLAAGAALFGRSVIAALSLNPGFETDRLVTTSISLRQHGYNERTAAAFFEQVSRRLQDHPEVESLALSDWQGGMGTVGKVVVDGVPRQFPSLVSFVAIDEHHFDTVGLRLIGGRGFSADDRENSPPVTIVSESFGRQISSGGNPLGRRITMPYSRPGQPPEVMEVVGVVPDVITNVAIAEPLVMYLPFAQRAGGTSRTLTVRAGNDANSARREILSAVRQIDRAVIPGPMLTWREQIGRQMSAQRFGASVLGSLSVIAVLLTVLGAYVLAESMATLRTREMGIRAALGASGRHLAGIVLAQTGRLIGLGLAIGLLLAWLGANTIRSFLFQVQPLDVPTLAGVAGAILALTMAVSLRPALRAARVDLASVLRAE